MLDFIVRHSRTCNLLARRLGRSLALPALVGYASFMSLAAEQIRLEQEAKRTANWKRWGPYLAERQWGTVREDYSADGNCWEYFPHDHARSRAYRWGEDGLLGWTDRECRLCFALALWNGKDPILKERLFGLTNPQGNHGEDVKEEYFYLDSTPTHSYAKALYKYPQARFPYEKLVEENARRGRQKREFELADTGVFEGSRYFDVFVEYAKNGPDDVLIRIRAWNRGAEDAELHLLPTLWFRNCWSWGCTHEGCEMKPWMRRQGHQGLDGHHATLGRVRMEWGEANGVDGEVGEWGSGETKGRLLFTDNESNRELLFGYRNERPYVKDAFHNYVVKGDVGAVDPKETGTKAAVHWKARLGAGAGVELRLRLRAGKDAEPGADAKFFGNPFERVMQDRIVEADEFFDGVIDPQLNPDEKTVARQAYGGLLWSKQFYHYVVLPWLQGDPDQPAPPVQRHKGRNHDWGHLFNRDVLSMPDKWEYPWFAAWDLAFHMIPFAQVDPKLAKDQLLLLLREWYMHPNGQIPAYEFALNDVNPPVHAWACWRVYKMTGKRGERDRLFLARAFQKLLINFTWWVNRKDVAGKHVFAGGFLGLDNIGVFDRNQPLPTGRHLEQADGTAWMAFYCSTMLSMALELASEDPSYEDVASKFFEHFVAIADAMNTLGGTGLWDDHDGFYYDQLHVDTTAIPLRVRSMVGLIPLLAVEVLEEEQLRKLPGFRKRMQWFLDNRADLARHIAYCEERGGHHLLAIPSRPRLERVLRYVLDETEFLSPHGVRSLSAYHRKKPYSLRLDGQEQCVRYVPGESDESIFGGNSNWRGPVWFPVNYLLVEALERYHRFYGSLFKVECPTGSGRMMNLAEVSLELSRRMTTLFLPRREDGRRPCVAEDGRFAADPHFSDLILFHEYFDGDTGRGLGASHQTGWTALVTRLLETVAQSRQAGAAAGRSPALV